MVFAQKCPFFETSVFYGKIGQENVFYDILERKNTFLGYKNKKFKKSKNCIILKGLIHGFWTKMSFAIFQKGKTPSLAIKIRSSKSRKIDIFSKGLTHGFGPKMAIFPTFFFRQYRPGKYPLRYSRTKKRLPRQ